MFAALRKTRNALLAASLAVTASQAAFAEEAQHQGTHVAEIDWIQVAPGAETGVLWGDITIGPYGMLVRLQPGFEFPTHTHLLDYKVVVIQGNWARAHGDTVTILQSGSYAFQPGGEPHADRCDGPFECINYLTQDGPYDVEMVHQ